MSNDLGFLIIFIVLPTAVIVSGVWLMLIVRSDLQLRSSQQPNTSDNTVEDLGATASADDLDNAGTSEDLEEPAVATAELATGQPHAEYDEEEEFWTPVPASQSPTSDLVDDEDVVDPQDTATQAEGQSVPEEFGDTANLPAALDNEAPREGPTEAADDASQLDEDTGLDEEPQRRRPTARMVPSTENVLRRTGQPQRPSPAATRSNVRDEGPVERPDGS